MTDIEARLDEAIDAWWTQTGEWPRFLVIGRAEYEQLINARRVMREYKGIKLVVVGRIGVDVAIEADRQYRLW